MVVTKASLPEVLLVKPDVHRDARGFFLETYHALRYAEQGVAVTFVQDNHSRSEINTIRGLHLQLRRPQGKLIRVIEGEIFDVAADVRRGSPTFGKWVGTVLSAENVLQCYVPPGFAHGFAVTSAFAQVEYKCTEFYDPSDELGLAWDDPTLAVRWPVERPVLSARDARNRRLADLMTRLPDYSR
ncbi:MAG TPA: dTDP-4-dehydrorhamnose 3,5-epimerase [Vicinamibacterales bacterium]|nr:dTDP-4-dehydrorhamnose 3,5-epimerase [Vicinamibacterales bacterium]